MSKAVTLLSNRVQPHVSKCPRPIVDDAVIDAVIKFVEESYFFEQIFEHDFTEGDATFTDADNDSINILLTDYISSTLRPVTVTEFKIDGVTWETQYEELLNDLDDINIITAHSGVKLFYYPDTTHIKFYGMDNVDQVLTVKQVYTYLTTITTIDDYLYERYHKAMEAGALWELQSMEGKDWANPLAASSNLSIYKQGVARAKSEREHGYTKGSMRVKSTRLF